MWQKEIFEIASAIVLSVGGAGAIIVAATFFLSNRIEMCIRDRDIAFQVALGYRKLYRMAVEPPPLHPRIPVIEGAYELRLVHPAHSFRKISSVWAEMPVRSARSHTQK